MKERKSCIYPAWPMNKKVASVSCPSRLCEQENSLLQSKWCNMIIVACRMCAGDERTFTSEMTG